jgi:hypothetical protein
VQPYLSVLRAAGVVEIQKRDMSVRPWPIPEHDLRDALELDVQLVAAEKASRGTSSMAGFLVSRPRCPCSALEQVLSRETMYQRVARTRSGVF